MNERDLKTITIIITLVALTPLMLVNSELWDTIQAEMAWIKGDFSIINVLIDYGWYLKYYTYYVTDYLNHLTGIPHKFFTNLFSALSIIGIAREVFLILLNDYRFERKTAYIGSWAVIAFPVWHTLISSAVFINIFCFWLFMIAIRLWKTNKILSLCFLIPSLQIFSFFAFTVGFIASDFVLTANKKNYKRKIISGTLLSICLLIGFKLLMNLINVHGPTGQNYNTFNLERLDSFINFGAFTSAVFIIIYCITRKMKSRYESEQLIRHTLSFLVLTFFAGLAYWSVGRPMRFFSFGSFTARHTYLMCVPFAVLVAIVVDNLSPRINPKTAKGILTLFILTLLILVHQGYSHKVAAVIFKDMLTESFAELEAPPSGYVAIFPEGYEAPRHVHTYAINMCLFKAYGRSSWMANGYWLRDSDLSRESLEKMYDGGSRESARSQLALDVTGDAYTKYTFTLSGYHQEGRFWYWIYHILGYYDAFKPTLELR